jgi:ketosteroid isomerase-like protein
LRTIQPLARFKVKRSRHETEERLIVQAMESELLSGFREAYLAGNRAWNQHDFGRAYAALPEGVEYRLSQSWPNARPLRGRHEVVAFFEGFHDAFPEVEASVRDFVAVDEHTIVAGLHVTGTGRGSGATVEMDVWQVWELAEGLVPERVAEYDDRQGALEAARSAGGH